MREPKRRAVQPKKPTQGPKGPAPTPPPSSRVRNSGCGDSPYQPASRRRCPHCGRRIG